MGYGAGLAVVMGAFDYTGGTLTGYEKDPSVDEYARKEALRKNRRRPIQETIEELGEGRGRSRNMKEGASYILTVTYRHLWSRLR